MTYYLHNNKLYNIDRMPPERNDYNFGYGHNESDAYRRDRAAFAAYLSTLIPIPHELKGEGVVALDRDFKWDLRGIGDPLYGSTGQPSYKAWQRVAVPIEAKEEKCGVCGKEGGGHYINCTEHFRGGRSQPLAPQQQPAKETMLEQLADLLRKHDVRKYLNVNDSGYSQVERDIVDLFAATPSSVSNPVAKELKQIRDAFQWTFDNMGTPHTSDHFNVPANAIEQLDNLIALFTSQHGEQQEQNKWMEAGLRLVAELYKKHRFILKNLDVANEDKNIFLYRLGISTEHMDNH